MLQWIIHIVLDAVVLLIAAKFLSKVHLNGFKSALIVALIIGVLSFLLSWLLTAVLNIATLGIFYFLGLGFITRVVAYAIVIEIADKLTSDFKTEGFLPSLWLAILIAIVGAIVDALLF
ncbi:phage holin family protein [Christiangramia marina]|jgi:putative membrane protein|uniref:phage holin family protein n=1 Tax=Christiangramia TaxID=292691 RepID=UPI0011542EAD|nr:MULTISPECIES: phage holin family protein [unclassified Christiangramia]TQI70271.1 putative membrane protein [Gramella sp. Hel_I_59]WPY99570.1 phage holin family protein [Christiangramia sp. OXR-203]|tara:strand:- start:331 stop:687 length:357 start_codon:yes stop_codon:yes gene_type:complete